MGQMATRKTPLSQAGEPGTDAELRAELLSMVRTLEARATSTGVNGQELKQLVRRVRAAIRGEPLAEKARENHARSLLLSYCMMHSGEGKLPARRLKTAAEVVAIGLADAMPEFADRAQTAKREIAAMIAAHAALAPMPRGRPTKIERLTALMGKPDLDVATRNLCVAMGWSAALPKSIDRQQRRQKK